MQLLLSAGQGNFQIVGAQGRRFVWAVGLKKKLTSWNLLYIFSAPFCGQHPLANREIATRFCGSVQGFCIVGEGMEYTSARTQNAGFLENAKAGTLSFDTMD